MTNELIQWIQKYDKAFPEDGFPTIPLAMNGEDEDVIAIIKECLDKGKDVYELGFCTLEDVMY